MGLPKALVEEKSRAAQLGFWLGWRHRRPVIEVSQFESVLGKVTVAERDSKVLAVAFGGPSRLRREHPELWSFDAVKEVRRAECSHRIRRYLAGESSRLDASYDLALVRSAFDRKVFTQLSNVKAGHTVSYGELANKAGHPGAARAVGGAMRRNPIPIVVPCHRVLPSTGRLGNYTGGVEKKSRLLALEGIVFD